MKYEDFINSTEFTYKLYLQDYLADASVRVPELTLVQLVESDLKYEGADYKVAVNDIKFNRKIYQPGEISAELMITLKGDGSQNTAILKPEKLKALLIHRRVKLTILPKNASEETAVAENYYIHEIRPRVMRDSAATQVFVTLFIYSMDKLMTLNKYSQAYVAKKLGSEILCDESKRFGYNKTALVRVSYDNMQHLKYQQSEVIDGKAVNIPSEFIQPYLVQYNETFYDFIARTANRCGEFLFFEDGQLVLGMPKQDLKEVPFMIKGYASLTYQNISPSPLSIKAFTRDSAKGNETLEFNDTPVANASTGFPEDTFGTDLTYNSELAHDDYIFPMFKDKFSSFGRVLGISNGKEALTKLSLDVFSRVVGNTNEKLDAAKDMGKSMAIKYGLDLAFAKGKAKGNNKSGNKKWIDPFKDNIQQYDGTKAVQFAPVAENAWVKLAYYSQIRSQEEAQQEQAVCVDMGTACIPVKLGQIVTIDNLSGKFVIVQIIQNSATPRANENLQEQKIFAIPVIENGSNLNIVPPVWTDEVVRKSGPQTAFVVSNHDPKNQGRVRIAFPWQIVGKSKKVIQEAQEDLKQKKTATEQAKSKQSELESQLNRLNQHSKTLGNLQKELEDEPDKMKQNQIFNQKLQDNLKQMTSNQAKIDKLNDDIEQARQTQEQLEEDLANIKSPYAVVKVLMKAQSEYTIAQQAKKIAEMELQHQELVTENLQREKLDKALAGFKQSGVASPVDYLKTTQDNLKAGEIATTEQKISEAKTEVENAQIAQSQAQAEVDQMTAKWNTQLEKVASPWVRVAMPMATSEGGVYFRPKVGDEVLVNFDNGNVERPYVSGSLYSKEHTDPGGDMVIKSPSGQKISFGVAGDGMGFVQNVSPFLTALQGIVPGLIPDGSLGDDARKLCGDITFSDEFGMFNVKMSSTNRKVSIASPFGDVSVSAFTGITISAPNGDVNIVGKNVNISAGNNLRLTSGTNVNNGNTPTNDGNDEVNNSTGIDEKKPGFWSKVWSGTKSTAADWSKEAVDYGLNYVGGKLGGLAVVDMKLLRCMCDVFLRPIEGTLCVKSKNYLMLEAGKGHADVNVERYSKNWQKVKGYEKDADKQMFYSKTVAYINRIDQKVEQFCRDYTALKKDALRKQKAYEKNLAYFWDAAQDKPKIREAAFKLGDDEFKKNDDELKGGTVDLSVVKLETIKGQCASAIKVDDGKEIHNVEEAKEYINPSAEAYAEAVWRLQRKTREFKTCFTDTTLKAINQATTGNTSHKDTEWIDKAFKKVIFEGSDNQLDKAIEKWQDRFGSKGADPKTEFLGEKALKDNKDIFGDPKFLKRKMIALFLLELSNDTHNSQDAGGLGNAVAAAVTGGTGGAPQGKYINLSYKSEAEVTDSLLKKNWDDVVILGPKKSSSKKMFEKVSAFVDKHTGITSAWKPVLDPDKPYMGWDRKVWSDKSGKIIFSDTKNATYGFNGENIEKWSKAGLSNEESLKQTLGRI